MLAASATLDQSTRRKLDTLLRPSPRIGKLAVVSAATAAERQDGARAPDRWTVVPACIEHRTRALAEKGAAAAAAAVRALHEAAGGGSGEEDAGKVRARVRVSSPSPNPNPNPNPNPSPNPNQGRSRLRLVTLDTPGRRARRRQGAEQARPRRLVAERRSLPRLDARDQAAAQVQAGTPRQEADPTPNPNPNPTRNPNPSPSPNPSPNPEPEPEPEPLPSP